MGGWLIAGWVGVVCGGFYVAFGSVGDIPSASLFNRGNIMRRLSFITVFLFLSVPALAEDTFVCVAELATGFTFDSTQKNGVRPPSVAAANTSLVSPKVRVSGVGGLKGAESWIVHAF